MRFQPDAFFTGPKAVPFLALAACLLWGSAFPAIKFGYALFGIAPADTSAQLAFAGYRFALAGVLVLAFLRGLGQRVFPGSAKDWMRLAFLGLIMTSLQYVFFYIGLAHTTGVKGAVVNSVSTFFSVILAHFFYANDHLTRRTMGGCLIGFLGVVTVNWNGSLLDWGVSWKGEGLLATASFCWALAGIYGKAISQTVNPMLMTGWQLLIGGTVLIILGRGAGGHLTEISYGGSVLLGYMAFLSAAAFVIYSLLMKYNPVSRITVFNFSIPLFGAVLSALVLGERLLEWKNFVALLLVCAGIWLVNFPGKRGKEK